MNEEVTRLLNAVEAGDGLASEQLIPLAYKELRQIAASKLAEERPGHTLQPTALVHEAWIRLVGPEAEKTPLWKSRGHFFAAAAEAMRRILIESARRKMSAKRGSNPQMTDLNEDKIEAEAPSERLIAVDEALESLEEEHPEFAKIVKMKYFAGMTVAEIAAVLDTSESTINRTWKSAKVWLYREIGED